MNKKVLFALVFIISFSCIWAVWEGNGGIGSSSDFPAEGLFVRSDMFPKHTLLEITNLEKNIKARAVVIGPSGIPGLLVSLSPELGEELKVPMGKVVRMRVFTPSPVNEDGDDGKSISTTSPESQDLDTNPALFVASHSDLPNANIKNEETKPVSENTYGDTILYDSIESHIDDTETSETVEAAPVEEDSSAETPLENTTTEEEVPNVEAILDPAAEETAESVSTEPVEEVEAPEVKPNKPPVEDSSLTHRPETVDTATEIYMEPATEKPPVTVAPISEPEPEKEAPPAPVTEISEPSEPEQAKEEIKEVEVVDPVAEPVKAPVEEKKVDTVSDVTPKNEPASDTSEDLPAPVEKISIEETPAEEAEDSNSYDETDSDIYSVTTQEKAEETSVMSINSETETVPNTLEKGKTYVQIVIYNDKYNRDETLKKYGKNYPMVVEERLIKNNTRYTIFVGPLKADETGAVLERFKQLGFKDAFIKKGK